jgi:hypothetical protein
MVFAEWSSTLGEKALSFEVLFAVLRREKRRRKIGLDSTLIELSAWPTYSAVEAL